MTQGLASTDVTLADPAMGTGTYLLGGAAPDRANDGGGSGCRGGARRDQGCPEADHRLRVAVRPFAVAQLRLLAEVADLLTVKAVPSDVHPRLYVTDTLGNPDEDNDHIPHILKALADSRKQANAVKRAEPITVVIGNPPYKEKAKGRGGLGRGR